MPTKRKKQTTSKRLRKSPVPTKLSLVLPSDWNQCDPQDLKNPSLYINRELSWIEFNRRVLEQARDPFHPLLERVRFLSIAGSNLDEFFMIRLATILKKFRAGIEDTTPDGLTTSQQLWLLRDRAQKMMRDKGDVWENELRPLLEKEKIFLVEPDDYTPEIEQYLHYTFNKEIYPVLTPLAFDPGHPFPYISNLSMNFAVVVHHNDELKFARVKIPKMLPRFVALPEKICGPGIHFAFLEDVIKANMNRLFPKTPIEGAYLFRIVRDTDIVIQEAEADDLLESVDRSLKQLRYGDLSLLEVEQNMPQRILDILAENFDVEEDVIVRTHRRMNFSDWKELTKIQRPLLKYTPFFPKPVFDREEPSILFDQLKHQDYLVHHPYESFASVENFLSAAVHDPHVVAIKMTLYRIGENSPIIKQLIEAAEAGKQVAVLVELKARFDEKNNIAWASQLESVGVHVVYGLVNLKTHAKLCLIVRKENEGVRRYAHLGTGNYNRMTAQVYTDIGIFTANPEITEEVSEVFNYLTGYSSKKDYRKIMVAPLDLRSRFMSLIEREIQHAREGRKARIIIKNNSTADMEIMKALYLASQAGVNVDMIVRGVCCLRPGIPGISDHIRVISIVGRFLEHSRIYYFENNGEEEMYLGSADLMERNLDRRVETLCPILDKKMRDHLKENVLERMLKDNHRATRLKTDGRYEPITRFSSEIPEINIQSELLEMYTNKNKNPK